MPTPRSVANIKSNLLQPALTSHFEVSVPVPDKIKKNVLEKIGINLDSIDQDRLNLMCSEASLPGSSLATLEINNDYTGVTERHAHRRIYDDRIDFTFYVNADSYLPIIVFESWIKYIVGESETPDERMRGMGSISPNYFYRVRYPNSYVTDQGLKVIKFERDYKSRLEYEFVRAYPISITSMPVSYEASNLLKCTVSMSYIRYILRGFPYSPTDPKSVSATQQSSGYGDPSLEQAVQRAFNPLSGSGFGDTETEAGFQRLNNPQFTPGFASEELNRSYNAVFNSPRELSITDFPQ